jgi:hypothetical protein
MPESQKEHPEDKKKAMEAPTNLYEMTFSSLGPTSHVNLLLDVKVHFPLGRGYEIISPFTT